MERGVGCCGGDKRACIVVVEPRLAVRAWGNGEGWAGTFDLTCHVLIPFGRGGDEVGGRCRG